MLVMGFQCLKHILNFLNSQFISSMLGAFIASGVAIKIARTQSKEQLELLKEENKNQKNFFKDQEKNERERIYIQYSVERAFNAIKCVEALSKYDLAFENIDIEFDRIKENYISEFHSDEELSDEYVQNIITSYCIASVNRQIIQPKFMEIEDSFKECLISLTILDEKKLLDGIKKLNKEFNQIEDWVYKFSKVKTELEYRKHEEEFSSNNLNKVCNEIRNILLTYITKQIAKLNIN